MHYADQGENPANPTHPSLDEWGFSRVKIAGRIRGTDASERVADPPALLFEQTGQRVLRKDIDFGTHSWKGSIGGMQSVRARNSGRFLMHWSQPDVRTDVTPAD